MRSDRQNVKSKVAIPLQHIERELVTLDETIAAGLASLNARDVGYHAIPQAVDHIQLETEIEAGAANDWHEYRVTNKTVQSLLECVEEFIKVSKHENFKGVAHYIWQKTPHSYFRNRVLSAVKP